MTQRSKPDLFKDWMPSIMSTKEYIFTEEVEDRDYPAYMVNRSLSQHRDCLFYANQMNAQAALPNRMQYDYLMATIRKARRPYVPWAKKLSDANIKLIQRHFGYSQEKALNALKILSEEQVDQIKALYKDIKI